MAPNMQKTKRTVVYKTVDGLDIKADIYTHVASGIDADTPVLLYFHGGGIVACNRLLVSAHQVQSCLKRGWVLVSVDFRHLPQVTGKEVVEDAQDAYAFVREKLWGVLNDNETQQRTMQNTIVGGASGGGIVTFIAAHYFKPQPIALLIYYGAPNMRAEWLNSSRININNVEAGIVPLLESQVSKFLAEPVSTGSLKACECFDLAMLKDDLSQNTDWVLPVEDAEEQPDRLILCPWLVQTNGYPRLMGMVDKDLDDECWKSYPKTVLIHGTKDMAVPYQSSLDAVRIIGPHPAKLFTVEGQPHAFDVQLFLGDPGLKEVEEAWDAVEIIVKEDARTSV